MKKLSLLLILILFVTVSCTKDDLYSILHGQKKHHKPIVQHTELMTFLPAGELGGEDNVLHPGTTFPPTDGSKATLRRGQEHIQFNIHTTGLPEGAYTIWYAIFNDPSSCSGDCGEDDLMLPGTGVIWATGKVVQANGIGNFSDKLYVGEHRDPGTQEIIVGEDIASPLAYPKMAEVHLIVKYHGPASDDPHVLHEQISTFLGSCGENDGANSFDAGPVFGFQCFDPQAAIFPAPGEDAADH